MCLISKKKSYILLYLFNTKKWKIVRKYDKILIIYTQFVQEIKKTEEK
jgi:hypothetical protein